MRRTTTMASAISPLFHFFLLFLFSLSPHLSLGHRTIREKDGRESADVGVRGGHRVLMGFKETPSGSNLTYQCSPSGPCVACQYSEKNDEKYRCSETGYRIPFKCLEIGADSNDAKGKKIGAGPLLKTVLPTRRCKWFCTMQMSSLLQLVKEVYSLIHLHQLLNQGLILLIEAV